MYENIYALYLKCFPNYPVTERLFNDLLNLDEAHIVEKYIGDKLIGFSIIHGRSISLLCVENDYRRQGIGTELLDVSERYIKAAGYDRILLGRGKYYLLQGVPTDLKGTVPFFKKRGYTASWTSANMTLNLENFSSSKLNIPKSPEGVNYRFSTNEDRSSLLCAVNEAMSSWLNVFKTCVDPVFVAVRGDNIIGFEVLAPTGGRFVGENEKVGCVGCVGVIPSERERGIGRQLVVNGINWLKSQKCTSIELRYVEIVDWYTKIGFEPTRHQWMGEKMIQNDE